MAKKDNPPVPEEEPNTTPPGEEKAIPDIRIVTVMLDVDAMEESGEVEVDLAGVGHYEAIGMLVSGVLQLLMDPFSNIPLGDVEDSED
ncbi:hypothetical protein UFOVP978_71 [uncultured Caudovirales phage]|uniref:Uncharacterized protein n=1 Tax=uncultured Caudovirales phage TaxID=2100421 RepID=A0A6J5Q6B5_9CAUD|nr:hypothetical protein UFOVP978_71 [uncultured Caudovirales phage]